MAISPERALSSNHMAGLAAALRTQYGIEATAIEPTERGKDFFASVYRVWVGEPTPRYIVKVRPADAARDTAVTVARYLADAGIPSVVAPIRTLGGAVSVVSTASSLTVYPFIEGAHGIEVGLSADAWRAIGASARRLHATVLPPVLAALVPRESYRPAEIETIAGVDEAVAELARPDAAARRVRDQWRDHRQEIRTLARRTEALGDALRRRSLPLVVCHADMHTGNVIVDPTGRPWIIDWDDVVLAPKERDLMFVVGGGISAALVDDDATARFLEGYGETDIDEAALSYYRHAWAVQDIGSYAGRVILDPSASPGQRDDAARILVGLFAPGEIVDLAARSLRPQAPPHRTTGDGPSRDPPGALE